MADNKTKETDSSVEAFLNGVEDEKRRKDSFAVMNLIKEATGIEPHMWGSAIIGFGSYHYEYESGREGDMPLVGFSPRKQNLTFYIRGGLEEYDPLLNKLGKHKTGKGCLYVNKLEDIDLPTLRELVKQSVDYTAKKSDP